MLKVTEQLTDSVKIHIRGSAKPIEGDTFSRVPDYTFQAGEQTIHLGDCFIVGNHILPAGIVEKVTAKQTKVEDVVVYGVQRLNSIKSRTDSTE